MADKTNPPISFRPKPEALPSLEKIISVNENDWSDFTQSDAINKAIIEYAKTLPPLEKKKKQSISSPVRP